ncbi:unnamed protein product [Rhodiola kirilowii]
MDASSIVVETIFEEFKGRRAGLIKALTTDVDEFFQQCDPEKENLCLYGFPDETWEVSLPAEEIPPEIPEPVLGINFARDGMPEKDWLAFVAIHCDTWLLSVAFYYATRRGLGQSDRPRLFRMINSLPTICETFIGSFEKEVKEKSIASNNGINTSKSLSGYKRESDTRVKFSVSVEVDEEVEEEDVEEDDDDDEQDDNTECGICKEKYSKDEFWICCDLCENWFHGKCVKITEARAAHIKQYKCPSCCKQPRLGPKT